MGLEAPAGSLNQQFGRAPAVTQRFEVVGAPLEPAGVVAEELLHCLCRPAVKPGPLGREQNLHEGLADEPVPEDSRRPSCLN